MVFSSSVFLLVFFPIMLIGYYFPLLSRSRAYKNYFLLLGSLIFYAWGEPLFVCLMIFSIFITWGTGVLLPRVKRKKIVLVSGVVYHVVILFVFKYLTFTCHELWRLFPKSSLDLVNISLPIGISFFTFQMMSYIFDVYYEKVEVQKNILNLGLYVALFPQLIAGPIVRYSTIALEIDERRENFEEFKQGLARFILGIGKKALIADFLAIIANNAFAYAKTDEIGMLTAWLGAIAYTLEIYFDFSGYSDMAIGLGLCFGFHFSENFNYPYLARSINEFWKKWHISLTDWFRDYVYIPLGGNRGTRSNHIRNIVLVWILTGIWHGANWTFIIWGMIYCLLQLGEKYLYKPEKWYKFFSHAYTLICVCFLWVIFRADSVYDAYKFIKALIIPQKMTDDISMNLLTNGIVILIVGVIGCFPLKKAFTCQIKNVYLLSVREITKYCLLLGILIMTLAFSISGGYSPFIYFNF